MPETAKTSKKSRHTFGRVSGCQAGQLLEVLAVSQGCTLQGLVNWLRSGSEVSDDCDTPNHRSAMQQFPIHHARRILACRQPNTGNDKFTFCPHGTMTFTGGISISPSGMDCAAAKLVAHEWYTSFRSRSSRQKQNTIER